MIETSLFSFIMSGGEKGLKRERERKAILIRVCKSGDRICPPHLHRNSVTHLHRLANSQHNALPVQKRCWVIWYSARDDALLRMRARSNIGFEHFLFMTLHVFFLSPSLSFYCLLDMRQFAPALTFSPNVVKGLWRDTERRIDFNMRLFRYTFSLFLSPQI